MAKAMNVGKEGGILFSRVVLNFKKKFNAPPQNGTEKESRKNPVFQKTLIT